MKFREHQDLLRYLQKNKPTRKLVQALPDCVVKALCEIALNVISSNLLLTEQQERFFSKNKKIFQKLSQKRAAIKQVRKLLKPQIVAALLDVVAEFLHNG